MKMKHFETSINGEFDFIKRPEKEKVGITSVIPDIIKVRD